MSDKPTNKEIAAKFHALARRFRDRLCAQPDAQEMDEIADALEAAERRIAELEAENADLEREVNQLFFDFCVILLLIAHHIRHWVEDKE